MLVDLRTVSGAERAGICYGFGSLDFLEPLTELAKGFQGDSDRFTMLWMVYEEGYAEGMSLREKVGA